MTSRAADSVALVSIVLMLVAWLGIVAWAKRRFQLSGESARKFIHMGMGCATLTFPWIFGGSGPVIALALIACVLLLGLKAAPRLDDALRGVDRASWGELYFPIGVAAVFHFAEGDPILYCPPILMLTFGDALAALAGKRFGSVRYTTHEGFKSLQGSLAFLAASSISIAVALALLADYALIKLALVALLLGLAGLILEAISWRGLDNLFVPVFGYLLMASYDALSAPQLFTRLLMLAALIPACMAAKRRSTMNDSSLLGAALALYLCWAVGGWTWMLPPLLTLALFPRVIGFDHRLFQDRQSSIALLALISVPLLWLAAYSQTGYIRMQWPFAAAFAMHLAMIWGKRAYVQEKRRLAWLCLGVLPALATVCVAAAPTALF